MQGAVEIVEVAPRDGLQNESAVLPAAVKVELIRRAIDAGARRIEAASFVHPRRVPQMADAEAVMAAVPRVEGVTYSGLVLNRQGFDRALAAGVDEVNVVVISTDEFSERNQGCTTLEALEAWADIAEGACSADVRATLTISAAFGCPFTGEVSSGRIVDIAQAAVPAKPVEIVLADTIGAAVPPQVQEVLQAVRPVAPGIPLRLHLHNTRNAGYANAWAGLEAGATALDASLGGIGGCPFAPAATGNVATEDLCWMLERGGLPTGIDVAAAAAAGTWIGQQLGRPPDALVGRAGRFPA